MTTIRIETHIRAPPALCFDRARSVEAHTASAAATEAQAVGGITGGFLGPGDVVTWEAVHLGRRHRLTAKVTDFDRPRCFVDEQVRGPFRTLTYVREFRAVRGGTVMPDAFTYTLPWSAMGWLVDRFYLRRYLHGFSKRRAEVLMRLAEDVT